jgi:Fe-S cluster assembly protein SufD
MTGFWTARRWGCEMTIDVSTIPDVGGNRLSARVDRTAYLAHLLSLRSQLESAPDWLTTLRNNTSARVQELAIPSTRDEDWRFTDLSSLLQLKFACADHRALPVSDASTASEANSLVIVNGVCSANGVVLADRPDPLTTLPSGLFAGSLARVLQHPELAEKLHGYLAQQPGSEDVFTALNTASFCDVTVVWVPKNLVVEIPLHLLFLATTNQIPQLSHPRCFVFVEAGSRLTLIEEYQTLGDGIAFSNAVTEIYVGENASLNHSRIQHENVNGFHIGKTAVTQLRDSSYTCNAISWGGAISRHNLEITSQGEQTQTHLNGLTRIQGEQVADTHSAIAHTRPYGSSRQIHKCIIDDRAHAVFNGRVLVPQAAQLTDAAQLSRNLLLSSKARIDTKPQLEIVADNVKCSHGATVSQLEQDEIFYLQSRGLDRAAACELLVYAFATDILNRIPVDSVRDRLIQQLATSTTRAS